MAAPTWTPHAEREATDYPRKIEWRTFEDEQGGALKLPAIGGIALELHLLDDEDRFLPVWLLACGTLLKTIEPGQT